MGNIITSCFRSGESVSSPAIDVQHDDYTANIDTVPNKNQVRTTLNQPMSPRDLRAQVSHEEVQKNLSESAEQKVETSTTTAAISEDIDAFESASKDPKSDSNAVGSRQEHLSIVAGFRSLTSYPSNSKDTTITLKKLSESAEQKAETSTVATGISDDKEAFGPAWKEPRNVSSTVGRRGEYLSAVTGFSSLTAYHSNPKDITITLREKKSMGLGNDKSDNDKEEAGSCASRVVRASNRFRQLDSLWDMGDHQSGPEKVNEYKSRSVQELVAHFDSDIAIIHRNEDDPKRRSVQEIVELFESKEAKCDMPDEKKYASELQEDEFSEDSQLEVVDLESADSVASVALEIKTSSPEDFRFVASPTHIDSLMM